MRATFRRRRRYRRAQAELVRVPQAAGTLVAEPGADESSVLPFDRAMSLTDVADGNRAMDARQALKVIVEP